MFDLLRIRQARRAAYGALEPFVSRAAAAGPAPRPGDWLQPQIIGFLATAVTLIAMRHSADLRSHALAAVQSHVLDALTGIGPELIGEEICLLSSRCDAAFAEGAMGAVAFFKVLTASSAGSGDETVAGDVGNGPDGGGHDRMLDGIWDEHVGCRLRRAHVLG